jgi:hypothetical protein
MGNPKLSTFLIALVWISFVAVGLGLFVSSLSVNYGVADSSANVTLFNKMDTLNTEIYKYKNETENFKQPTGIIDTIGGYFSSGYKVMQLGFKSFDIFYGMLESGVSSINLGIIGENLKVAIILTVIILIVFGVIIRAITKTDM